jgi:hypothetical protein
MKRKIHIDRKQPDQKVIASHKNFESLLGKHQAITKRPRYNAIKVITGIVLIAIIGFLVLEAIEQEENAIVPPLGQDYVEFEFHVIDPQVESIVTLITGTSISIPANSLIDSEGKVVNDIAYVKVSEFRNPVDFFLSGIPMTYDSAGTEYTFESAGMIQIEAYNERGRLSLLDEKFIQVSMVAGNTERFNVYAFDTVQNEWNFSGTDTVVEMQLMDTTGAQIISSDKMVITKFGDVPDGYSMEEAEEMGMIESDTTYYNYGTPASIPIVDPEKDGEYAKSIWNARKKAQKEMLNTFKKRDELARIKRKELLEKQRFNDSLRLAYKNRMEIIQERESEVFREFQINQFGIWNCDRPILKEMPHIVEARFTEENAEFKLTQSFYLVDINLNAVYKFYSHVPNVTCDVASENLIWMIKNENEMLIVTKAEFERAAQAKTPMNLVAMKTDEALEYLREEIPSNLP